MNPLNNSLTNTNTSLPAITLRSLSTAPQVNVLQMPMMFPMFFPIMPMMMPLSSFIVPQTPPPSYSESQKEREDVALSALLSLSSSSSSSSQVEQPAVRINRKRPLEGMQAEQPKKEAPSLTEEETTDEEAPLAPEKARLIDVEFGMEKEEESGEPILVPSKIIIQKNSINFTTLPMPSKKHGKMARGDKSVQIFRNTIKFIEKCGTLPQNPSSNEYQLVVDTLRKNRKGHNSADREDRRKGKQLLQVVKAVLNHEKILGRNLSKKECVTFCKENKEKIIERKATKISAKDFPKFMETARLFREAILKLQIPSS